jgi:hypothetical protein
MMMNKHILALRYDSLFLDSRPTLLNMVPSIDLKKLLDLNEATTLSSTQFDLPQT